MRVGLTKKLKLLVAVLLFSAGGATLLALTQPAQSKIFPAQNLHLISAAWNLPVRGLWVQFERRGWGSGYWPGQVIQQFNDFDPIVGHNVSEEVAQQLDAIGGMGVNTLTLELRTADQDANFSFPLCHINPVLGFQWPQPTASELSNLALFFDLIQSKGMRVILVLTNTHQEEQPPTNSQTWLNAILTVVKNHPALDFVVFNGDVHGVDTNGDGTPDSCGGQAETPLWLGPTEAPATYVKWAITYGMSLGMPASKLSAGAIVGDFFTNSEPPNPFATDGHLWSPIVAMKAIFDSLAIPDNQRTYALSFYEHRKCSSAGGLPCVDADPPTWAAETLQNVLSTVGIGSGARVVAYEMGNSTPVQPEWSTGQALENLASLLSQYGADGGSFWRWTSFTNSEDTDPTLAEPIKPRGVAFNYNPVKTVLEYYYTGHTPAPAANAASDVTSRSFTTNWSRSIGATGYRLDVSPDAAFSHFLPGYADRDVGNVTSFGVKGSQSNAMYYYRVKAYNSLGISDNSNIITVVAATAPSPTPRPSSTPKPRS